MNECFEADDFDPTAAKETLNRWLAGEVVRAQQAITDALEAYRFDDAAQAAYRFVRNSYCDWYLELAKPVLQGEAAEAQAETRAAARWALGAACKLLHPFMPFITEELWQHMHPDAGQLMLADWPTYDTTHPDADAELDWLIALVSEIRSVRAELNVPPAAHVDVLAVSPDETLQARLTSHEAALRFLARIALCEEGAADAVEIVVGGATYRLLLGGIVDFAAEAARLDKEIAAGGKAIEKLARKLADEAFLAKAPPEVVAENRARLADEEAQRDKLARALARLQ